MDKSIRIEKNDLTNTYQARDAAESCSLIVSRGFGGSVWRFLNALVGAYGFRPQYDKRTKAGREFADAERAMFEAVERFDRARRNLIGGPYRGFIIKPHPKHQYEALDPNGRYFGYFQTVEYAKHAIDRNLDAGTEQKPTA
ncbi:hypothetical protein [Burkholderia sp. MBR-1]|uniref:hypothetical protein n=1 Tax=Burkholderia sp. MBR-1 TaxID=2732364 RepID=UPI0015EE3978|nr:hypothetical protein [Burkholderia sp. MBR-1]QMI49923.1 hypothetical protein MBR110_31185 [Burkholderia sp. MBR-1]